MRISSWGGIPRVEAQKVITLQNEAEAALLFEKCRRSKEIYSFLPHGFGRSYGDVCLHRGTILQTRPLRSILSYDPVQGLIHCQAGCSLSEILSHTLADGWILPVLPGTQTVTLGGAIANDVHGKNHQHAGTFGRHVLDLELLRSDGQRWLCSPQQHADFFAATIGGLGLTGLILSAKIQLQRVSSATLVVNQFPFTDLAAYFQLAGEYEHKHGYTVAWLDCLKPGCERGVYWVGDFCEPINSKPTNSSLARYQAKSRVSVPTFFPSQLVKPWSMRAFNSVYYHMQASKKAPVKKSLERFFFPLDRLSQWNRVYGKNGFFQYQFVLPFAAGIEAFRHILALIHSAKAGAFLAVLKNFGSLPSPGLLSFPMPGYTLALDFPYRGADTYKLLDQLDAVVLAHGGRIYPAKDARMAAESFSRFFPQVERFRSFLDPQFSSAFWERVQPHGKDH